MKVLADQFIDVLLEHLRTTAGPTGLSPLLEKELEKYKDIVESCCQREFNKFDTSLERKESAYVLSNEINPVLGQLHRLMIALKEERAELAGTRDVIRNG